MSTSKQPPKPKHGGPRAGSGGARKGAGRPPAGTVEWVLRVQPETKAAYRSWAKELGYTTVGQMLDARRPPRVE